MIHRGVPQMKHCFGTIGLTLLLLLLAACGTQASTLTGSNNQAATATPLPLQHCGTIYTLGQQKTPTDQKAAKTAEDCFWQAYQQCHPATLVYSQASVDTAMVHNFALQKQNGKCIIIDALQHVIVPHAPQSAGNSTCTSLTQQADGLHVSACNHEGNVLVPAGAF